VVQKQSTGEVLHHGIDTWKFLDLENHSVIESFPISRSDNVVQILGHQGMLWKCADSQGNYFHTNPQGWTFQGGLPTLVYRRQGLEQKRFLTPG
jgi:hypothetical protein